MTVRVKIAQKGSVLIYVAASRAVRSEATEMHEAWGACVRAE